MSNIFLDTLNSASRLIPGGRIALGATLAGTSGALQGATWAANEFAKIGSIAGTPGEVSASLVGAGVGAVGGFFIGPLLGTCIGYDEGTVPKTARCLENEEVFTIYLAGKGKFGQNPQYTNIRPNLFDFNGRQVGSLVGLQLSRTPPSKLFQAPASPELPVDQPPVSPEEATEWTDGFYTFSDGSTMITLGMARTYLVPQRDGSIIFLLNNSHLILEGTGEYEGVQGVKQGIGSAYIPPGIFPSKFPAPGYEFSLNVFDTFRIIKRSSLRASSKGESTSIDRGDKKGR